MFGVIYTLKYKINKLCLVTLGIPVQAKRPKLRRVPLILAHSEVRIFAVCLGSRHTTKFESLPCALDAGTRQIRKPAPPSSRRHCPRHDPAVIHFNLPCARSSTRQRAGGRGSFAVSRAWQICLSCVFGPSPCAWGTQQMRGIR